MSNSNLKTALFIIRLGITIFFAVWAVEKFIKPDTTAAIWAAFYHVDALPAQASYAIGVLQTAAVACFFFGVVKFWSYGLLLVMHAGSTVLSYERILDPYTGNNHLFIASIPVLCAMIALFMLRREDTMLTLSGNKA